MVSNFTLAWLIDKIERVYGRMTPELRGDLYDEINVWANRLCKRWNFWFLEVLPGHDAITQFPITTSAISYPASNSRWFDRCWLATLADQFGYPFMMPLKMAYDVTDVEAPVQSGTQWVFAPIKRIKHVYRYTTDGAFNNELEVLPPAEFHRVAQYQNSGTPALVSWSDDGQQSTILMTPKPNDVYLLQFHVLLAGLPPLDRPHATHAFLENYPHVMAAVGCLAAARYFNEQDRQAEFMHDLYGPEWKQSSSPNFVPGGGVGEIIADTRNRRTAGADMQVKTYTSAAEALGRGGGKGRRSAYGRYYYEPD